METMGVTRQYRKVGKEARRVLRRKAQRAILMFYSVTDSTEIMNSYRHIYTAGKEINFFKQPWRDPY